MENKKGFTLVEMLAVLATFSIIFMFFLSTPVETMKKSTEQINFQGELSDVVLIRQALQRDLLNETIEISSNTVSIGKNTYEFNEDSVVRNGVKISSSSFSFSLEGNKLVVNNERISLEYYVGSSMTRGEDIWILN